MELCCIVHVFPVLVWCNVSQHNGFVKRHNTTFCVGSKSIGAGFTALSLLGSSNFAINNLHKL